MNNNSIEDDIKEQPIYNMQIEEEPIYNMQIEDEPNTQIEEEPIEDDNGSILIKLTNEIVPYLIENNIYFPIQFLMEMHPIGRYELFTIRNIDFIIHYNQLPSIKDHYELQDYILTLIRGNEIVICNDTSVRYPDDRPCFSGITGTLSNILTGYNFYLYDSLIGIHPMRHNHDDIINLLFLSFYFQYDEEGKVYMPEREYRSFCNIKSRHRGHMIFEPEFWREYINILHEINQFELNSIIESRPGLVYKGKIPIDIILSRGDLFPKVSSLLNHYSIAYYRYLHFTNSNGMEPNNRDIRGPYEKHPCYILELERRRLHHHQEIKLMINLSNLFLYDDRCHPITICSQIRELGIKYLGRKQVYKKKKSKLKRKSKRNI